MTPTQITIKSRGNNGEIYNVTDTLENNPDAWGADVALLKTRKKAPCWLTSAMDESVPVGEHVVTLGFPGLAFGSLSFYTGIVSGQLQIALPIGTSVQGMVLTSTVPFIRAQMPISPGLSGAPLIDDENRVIGIVTATAGVVC